ncbi:hypothetical protein OFAG_02350 [Oxalobacter formigenes HOxBLS]|uniref:Uncharacterized protein n=1 Tax=Oxalobacter paraformigenes TaxID=556268 RepID=T5LE43_9BURK|nr:hypothetical protein OFAG_02350 [Oxalobacter paraformigenes]
MALERKIVLCRLWLYPEPEESPCQNRIVMTENSKRNNTEGRRVIYCGAQMDYFRAAFARAIRPLVELS